MQTKKKRSPIFYVLIGCGSVIALFILVVVVIGVMGVRWVKQVERDMKDPDARTEKALALLGCERMPEGYNAMAFISVPFVMDLAILSDKEPDAEGKIDGFNRQGFIYMKMIKVGNLEEQLTAQLEGRESTSEAFAQSNVKIRSDEVIRSGVLDVDGKTCTYMTQRGAFSVENNRVEGIQTLFMIPCAQDSKLRFGVWFGPDPDPDAPVDEAEFEGSMADEDQIARFFAQFGFCPSRMEGEDR